MIKQPPVLLYTFANQQDDYLPLLKEEERHLRTCFSNLHDQKILEFLSLGSTSLDDIYRNFNRFHNRILIFHYGGHSDSIGLHLEGQETRATNLAKLMGMQDALQLVVLNGCSNQAQASLLLDAGVKVVIGTSCNIQDKQAVAFAEQFYEALVKGKSIGQAFDSALAYLSDKSGQPIDEVVRGIVLLSEKKRVPWALYYRDAGALDWTLPTQAVAAPDADEDDFREDVAIKHPKVNQLLIPQVAQGLGQYLPNVLQLHQRFEALKKQKSFDPALFLELKDQVLNHFPTPISGHIGALFSPRAQLLSRQRLQEINYTYLTLSRYLASIALSILWDAALDDTFEVKPDFHIQPEYRRDLLQFLQLSGRAADQFDYIWLFNTVSHILTDNGLSPFIRELADLQEKFTKDKATYQAYRFLEQALRQALAANKIAKDEIGTLCLQAEQHLGKLLAECAFLSTYELATIREIQVRKGKREAVASFLHENAVLRGTVDKTANIYALPREDYTENQSVIVSKNLFGKEKTLNLSPFIIDINAFSLKKQNLPDLHFWYGTDEKGQLCYQRISQMQDFFQVEKESDDAELMLSTFSVKYEGMDMLYELLDNFKTDLKLS